MTNFMDFKGPDFNLFSNLDSVEYRIINYIKESDTPEANRIWKLLKYSDPKALFKENLTQEDKAKLIYFDEDQNSKRVFGFNFQEDLFDETCSLIKVYVDSIVPTNHLLSLVNVGFEILSHDKISNVYNDLSDVYEDGRPVEENIPVKSRNTVILRSLLALLNGAHIEGVGKMQFDKTMSDACRVISDLDNRKNYYGYRLIMSSQMSGVGEAIYG